MFLLVIPIVVALFVFLSWNVMLSLGILWHNLHMLRPLGFGASCAVTYALMTFASFWSSHFIKK